MSERVLFELVIDELGDMTLRSRVPGWGLTPSKSFIVALVRMLKKASRTKLGFDAVDKEIETVKKAILDACNVIAIELQVGKPL